MGSTDDKPNLFRHITVPDQGIPRVAKDARETKNDMLRHLNLTKWPPADYYYANKRDRKARQGDDKEDTVT